MSNSQKKIYFASDFHLGVNAKHTSKEREQFVVKWLDSIINDVEHLYLMGDVFDFWFEYKKVVPKGFIRLQGKLAEMADKNIPITWFSGNHDLWLKDYFEKELGAEIIQNPVVRKIKGKTFYLAHGDGLGPGDRGYKFIKSVFRNKIAQRLFRFLHPDFGIGLAGYFSGKSRAANYEGDQKFLGEEKEWLIIHSNEILKSQHIDFFIYGHRHFPHKSYLQTNKSVYVNLGDWLSHYNYATYDGDNVELCTFKTD